MDSEYRLVWGSISCTDAEYYQSEYTTLNVAPSRVESTYWFISDIVWSDYNSRERKAISAQTLLHT